MAVTTWAAGFSFGLVAICLGDPMKSLDIHTYQIALPFHDIVDAVEVVFRCSDKCALFQEVAFEEMLPLSATVKRLRTNRGQVTESVTPT